MSTYARLLAAGVPLDSHESDLYAKVTPESTEAVRRHDYPENVRVFVSQIDGALWYDIPFAFDPFWERRARSKTRPPTDDWTMGQVEAIRKNS